MHRSSLHLVAILFVGVASSAVAADDVDRFIEAEMKKSQAPGISLAVVKDGKIIKSSGYGFANLEHQVPTRPETVFQSGSLGKQFTAAAVLLLMEDGKLGLDDPISKYLDNTPEAWKPITIRHLLTHTSGIGDLGPPKLNYRLDYTEADQVKLAAEVPVQFAPGEKWKYSNTGYVLLGVVIHKVSGQFYGDLLHERIFKPLEMNTTRILNEEEIIPNRAAGYRLSSGVVKNQEWVSPTVNTTADGSLYLTVLDLARWDAALYTDKPLSKKSKELMWTPVKLKDGKTHPYGFGWQLGEMQGRKTVEHGGQWQGFSSYILRVPDERLTVIVLINLAHAPSRKFAHGAAALYLAGDKTGGP